MTTEKDDDEDAAEYLCGILAWYVLDDAGEPMPASFMRWSRWRFEHPELSQLASTVMGEGDTRVRISTVFLSLDHGHGGPPVLWETMVFGGRLDKTQERYVSRDEALAGHARWCTAVRETLN